MPWFKVDDQLHDHRKSRKAGKAAMGVWVLAGSWSAGTLHDGFVPASVLSRWGTRADAKKLVVAGLWRTGEQDGEAGWWFENWEEYQPTKAVVEAERTASRERMKQWRSKRRNGVTSPVTDARGHTVSNGVGYAVTDDVRTGAPTRPDPTRPSDVDVVDQSQTATRDAGEDSTHTRPATNLEAAVATRLACGQAHAAKVVADIRSRTTDTPADPVRYVLACIDREPDRYRPTPSRGVRKADECPVHVGQPAKNCGGCAADAKAAS